MYVELTHEFTAEVYPGYIYDGVISMVGAETGVFRYGHPYLPGADFMRLLEAKIEAVRDSVRSKLHVEMEILCAREGDDFKYLFHAGNSRDELPADLVACVRLAIVRCISETTTEVGNTCKVLTNA